MNGCEILNLLNKLFSTYPQYEMGLAGGNSRRVTMAIAMAGLGGHVHIDRLIYPQMSPYEVVGYFDEVQHLSYGLTTKEYKAYDLADIIEKVDLDKYFEPEPVQHDTPYRQRPPRPAHRNLKTFSYSHRRK